jgi:GR25 family glycosyltransferase involved in LPS biosynthesis
MQQANLKAACILEDDVELSSNFPSALRSLSQHCSENVVAKLEPWRKRRLGVVIGRVGVYRTIYSPHALIETGAYFVTQTAVDAMTDLHTITAPYDRALFAERRGGPLLLTVSPAPAIQSDRFASLIQVDRDRATSRWRRMPRVLRETFRPFAQLLDFTRALLRVYERLGLRGLRNLRYEQVLIVRRPHVGKVHSWGVAEKPKRVPYLGAQPMFRGDRS